jgi:CRISPR-associated RAMP protein (TIGR02581 family)
VNTFEHFSSFTLIAGILEMQTALSVGSRISMEPTGSDLPVVKTPDGLPFIPGSSLKGVIRFFTERVLRSLDDELLSKLTDGKKIEVCDPLGFPCVPKEVKDKLWEEAEKKVGNRNGSSQEYYFAQKIWENSCFVCRLFGSPWLAGRLAFKDAFLTNANDLPVVTQVRDGVGIDRDLGAARQGVKYDFEAVVPGACFGIEIAAENVAEWEIGLLLAVLRPLKEGWLAIGGKSTRGPGRGKLRDLEIRRLDQKDLRAYLVRGREVMASVDEEVFLKAFWRKIGFEEGWEIA